MKGFDFYEFIDSFVGTNTDFTFTYIGRDRGTFKNTQVISPLFGADLGLELSRHDIYISGTRNDPGPNHILESLSCNIPTYAYIEGGGAVEFVGKDHTFSSIDQLVKIIESRSYTNNGFKPSSWKECINSFESHMVKLVGKT